MMKMQAATAVAALIAVHGTGTPNSSEALKSRLASAGQCGTYSVPAVIPGRHQCLADLNRCRSRFERQYRRYGFSCRDGVLVAMWRRLARPIHIPLINAATQCPISPASREINFHAYGVGSGIGDGPVYPAPFSANSTQPLNSFTVPSDWHSGKHAILILPRYRGPVLIRGRQLDGSGVIRFASNEIPGAPRLPNPGPALRIPAFRTKSVTHTFFFLDPPGCFAYQIDGTTFSKVVVFEVRIAR